MSNVITLKAAVDHQPAQLAFARFFDSCIGTHDDRSVLDVIITDSLIREFTYVGEKARVINHVKAYDVNFVFSNGKYRTFRVFQQHWSKVVALVKEMSTPGLDVATLQTEIQDPRFWEIKPTNAANHYGQAFAMQDLGCDYPISVLYSPEAEEYWKGVTDGDFAELEARFDKLAGTYHDSAKRVKANIVTLINDTTIVRNHNLFFSHFIDFDKRQLAVSLSRLEYKVDPNNEEEFQLTPAPYKEGDLDDVITGELGRQCLKRLTTAFNSFNEYAEKYFPKNVEQHPALTLIEDLLFKRMWSQIMPMSEQVYDMRADSMVKELDTEVEALLQHIKTVSAQPGLDMSSLKVWDYTDDKNPTMVEDIGAGYMLQFRPEFVKLITNRLAVMRHPLCRPHAVMKLVTDPKEIAARPIGDVRTESF